MTIVTLFFATNPHAISYILLLLARTKLKDREPFQPTRRYSCWTLIHKTDDPPRRLSSSIWGIRPLPDCWQILLKLSTHLLALSLTPHSCSLSQNPLILWMINTTFTHINMDNRRRDVIDTIHTLNPRPLPRQHTSSKIGIPHRRRSCQWRL